MKKYFLSLLSVMMATFMIVSIISCDKDDDGGGSNTNPLVGTWMFENNPDWRWPDYTFYADGTYVGYADYADEKGKYFYDELYKKLTLTGIYTKINEDTFDHSVGESHTYTFNVLSLSDKDLVVSFLYSDGTLKSFHYEKIK